MRVARRYGGKCSALDRTAPQSSATQCNAGQGTPVQRMAMKRGQRLGNRALSESQGSSALHCMARQCTALQGNARHRKAQHINAPIGFKESDWRVVRLKCKARQRRARQRTASQGKAWHRIAQQRGQPVGNSGLSESLSTTRPGKFSAFHERKLHGNPASKNHRQRRVAAAAKQPADG